ncbi:uncharacterized protein L201_005116 [Kwoniella dendrophila CBS 6074]|uniref:Uncharacterized protein n=1 Tax=Kwoniella dendrophila CBS 6074 TaxID=1295534 RepID=A0AAX4JZA7_9TREE
MTSPKPISPIDNNDNDDSIIIDTSITPPPSLVTISMNSPSRRGSAFTYKRSDLLSLANFQMDEKENLKSESTSRISRRLSSFTPILRCSLSLTDSNWGISEDKSSLFLFDNQPISKDLPIPKNPLDGDYRHPCDKSTRKKLSYDSSTQDSETLFDYQSLPKEGNGLPAPVPVLVNFNDPFQNQNESQSETISSELPNSLKGFDDKEINDQKKLRSSSLKPHSIPFSQLGMRMGPREDLVDHDNHCGGRNSKSNSISSLTSILSRRSSSASSASFSGGKDKNELNPFAPPFPLPNSTSASNIVQPKPIHHDKLKKPISLGGGGGGDETQQTEDDGGSLPLPKPSLLSSLPSKPSGLPPIFIKRESATLPQPMSLPDIAPLGEDWLGENSLSGNDKRRLRRDSNPNPNSRSSATAAAAAAGGNYSNSITRSISPLSMNDNNNNNNNQRHKANLGGSLPNSRRGSFSLNENNNIRNKSQLRANSPAFDYAAKVDGLSKIGDRLRRDSVPKQKW